MHFTVEPGLYALGQPDRESPVLVTANYKMSFDRLREALPGRSAWILALDTNGVNVWCAAGKGTFGTSELVARIGSVGLAGIVNHREVIVPQLGAPGIAAHRVPKLSGFKVRYGPIRAMDLPDFLDAGLKASPSMRVKTFPLRERAVLVPVELVGALKYCAAAIPLVLLLSGLSGSGGFLANMRIHGLLAVWALAGAIASGAILTPLLLPWLPGRAFSVKGFETGALVGAAVLAIHRNSPASASLTGHIETAALFLLVLAVSSYLGMNFTGSSTYTSLSGVRKEMRWAVPLQIGACVVSLTLWTVSLLGGFG